MAVLRYEQHLDVIFLTLCTKRRSLNNFLFQGCTNLAKVLLSLFNCYSRYLAVHHQIDSSFIQAPLPACFQCQVRTYSTGKNLFNQQRQMWGNNISILRFKGMNNELLQDSKKERSKSEADATRIQRILTYFDIGS